MAKQTKGSPRGPGRAGAAVKGKPGAPTSEAMPKISAAADGGVAGANRRERKEEARRQREALMRKMARRKYYRIGAAAVAALVAIGLVLALTMFKSKTPVTPGQLPGLITSTDTLGWDANTQQLGDRVKLLGLPPLTPTEILAFHIHQDLQIFINGKPVVVPVAIGIDQAAQQIAVIHTHRTDGVIHVESPQVSHVYTLGDVFGVWGLKFTPTCIGGYCNGGGKTLQVFLNGKAYSGDPTKLRLENHQVIVVTFGTSQDLPSPIPSTFDFVNSSAGG